MAIEAAQVIVDANTISTIINNINSLYSNLIAYTVGLLLFVGAFVPSIINFYQNRQFRKEQEEIKKNIGNEVTNAVIATEERLQVILQKALEEESKKIQANIDQLKQNLDKEIAGAHGSTYHLQANQQISQSIPALLSCKHALPLYIKAEQENNARKIIGIIDTHLNKIDKTMFDGYIDIDETIQDILKELRDNNVNSRYSGDIQKIEFGLKDAKKREPKAKP